MLRLFKKKISPLKCNACGTEAIKYYTYVLSFHNHTWDLCNACADLCEGQFMRKLISIHDENGLGG